LFWGGAGDFQQAAVTAVLNRYRLHFEPSGVLGQHHIQGHHPLCLGFHGASKVQGIIRTQSCGCIHGQHGRPVKRHYFHRQQLQVIGTHSALLDQVIIAASHQAYAEFVRRIDMAPKPNERLRKTMRTLAPWDKA
jgi:hypothetical protein